MYDEHVTKINYSMLPHTHSSREATPLFLHPSGSRYNSAATTQVGMRVAMAPRPRQARKGIPL